MTSAKATPSHITTSSPKVALKVVTPGTSSQTSQPDRNGQFHHAAEEAQSVVKQQVKDQVSHQSSQSDQKEEHHVGDQRPSHRERDTPNVSPKLSVLPPTSSLKIGSRVQIPTSNPNDPLSFGVIRWISDVKNRGLIAGVEMVSSCIIIV